MALAPPQKEVLVNSVQILDLANCVAGFASFASFASKTLGKLMMRIECCQRKKKKKTCQNTTVVLAVESFWFPLCAEKKILYISLLLRYLRMQQ